MQGGLASRDHKLGTGDLVALVSLSHLTMRRPQKLREPFLTSEFLCTRPSLFGQPSSDDHISEPSPSPGSADLR